VGRSNSRLRRLFPRPSSWTLGLDMQKFAGYLFWLLGLAGNGFVLFLWVVFGAAAAGNSNSTTNAFFAAACIGTSIAVVLSMYFVSKERFNAGFLATFLIMPLVIIFTLVLDFL